MPTFYQDDPEYRAELAQIMARLGDGRSVRRRYAVSTWAPAAPVITIVFGAILVALVLAALLLKTSWSYGL